ncbi:MAG TPA: hypothetical protein ENK51_00395 [Gammaproteobacteria bacterium]|nr:hypothetical protein [Gammaproteobacteria bacterium]
MQILLFLITVIALLGCKPGAETVAVVDCANTFVVSGSSQFDLLAYDKTSNAIRLIQHYEGEQRYQSSYICERDIVLSSYQFRGTAKEDAGFEIVHRNGKAEQVKFTDGPVDFVSYKGGILVKTNRLHAEPVDESLGDSPYLIRDRERGYSHRKDGKEVFLYTHYIPFSHLDDRSFRPEHSYRFSAVLGDSAGIYGDILLGPETVTPETGLYRLNLVTGRRVRLSKVAGSLNDIHVRGNGDRYYLIWPETKKYLAAIKGHKHLLEQPRPIPDDPVEARLQAYYRGMERDTLYRFEEDPVNGKWAYTKLKKIDGGIYHYISVDEAIYIFTRDRRAIRYDSVKDTWQEFPFEYSDRFERINAIGDGLAFTLKSRDGSLARVYVVSRDFSRISKPLTIDRDWSDTRISTRYNFVSTIPKWLGQ